MDSSGTRAAMSMEVNAAVVVGIGPVAAKIIKRARELILLHIGQETLPAIFQFLPIEQAEPELESMVTQSYYNAANKTSALKTEETTVLRVESSRVESFIIAPLDEASYETAARAARVLRNCARHVVAGGRNAVFLLPKRRHPQDAAALQRVADALDAEIKASPTFKRCFFIDEIDEYGRAITEDECIELVARYISLAVASELSKQLRKEPPPYIGEGAHHKCYASFSCSTINFSAQKLIDALSNQLASDICLRLFASSRFNIEETDWPEKAQHWLETSMTEPLINPVDKGLSGIRQDPDFIKAKAALDDLAKSACGSFGGNLHAYKSFIDHCLKQLTVRLESLSNKMANTKKKINELEIEIMLGHVRKGKPVATKTRGKVRPWPWIIALASVGICLLAAMLFIVPPEQELAQKLGIVAGAVLMLAAVALAIIGQKSEMSSFSVEPVSPAREELEKQKALFAQQSKRQSILVALFTYLDLAHANLENLRKSVAETSVQSDRNIFDLDLIDSEVAKKFYVQEYKNRDADITSFTQGEQFKRVYDTAFSFFDTRLSDSLRRYCTERFDSINRLNMEQLLQLRKSLDGYQELQAASSAFWYPHDPTVSERLVLAIIPESFPKEMSTILNNTFGARNINHVYSRDARQAVIIQVAYGQRLNNILSHPQPASNSPA